MPVADYMVYFPNPAHKVETTEAGPPRWNPDKEKCPREMTVVERLELLELSQAEDGAEDNPKRWAVWRTISGVFFFETKPTLTLPDGRLEVHGHPTSRVPPRILRQMRDSGLITPAEYNRFRKELG